jgi:hypothetical protein
MLRLLIASLFSAPICGVAVGDPKNEISLLVGGGSLIGADESTGVQGSFIDQCSIVPCHFWVRLRRAFKKRLREAPPPMTNDN